VKSLLRNSFRSRPRYGSGSRTRPLNPDLFSMPENTQSMSSASWHLKSMSVASRNEQDTNLAPTWNHPSQVRLVEQTVPVERQALTAAKAAVRDPAPSEITVNEVKSFADGQVLNRRPEKSASCTWTPSGRTRSSPIVRSMAAFSVRDAVRSSGSTACLEAAWSPRLRRCRREWSAFQTNLARNAAGKPARPVSWSDRPPARRLPG